MAIKDFKARCLVLRVVVSRDCGCHRYEGAGNVGMASEVRIGGEGAPLSHEPIADGAVPAAQQLGGSGLGKGFQMPASSVRCVL